MTKQFVLQRLARERFRSYARSEMIRRGLVAREHRTEDLSEAATFAEAIVCFSLDESSGTSASSLGDRAMDIFHPDFWSYCSSREKHSTTAGSTSVNDGLQFGQIGFSSTSVDQDNSLSSVASDVSGLTGVFDTCKIDTERNGVKTRKCKGCSTPIVSSSGRIPESTADTLSTTRSTRSFDRIPQSDARTVSSPSTHSSDGTPASIVSHVSISSSASSAQRQKKCRRKSLIRFSTVRVRQYERIMADNPACRSGPGIGIGWRYDKNEDVVTVDEWEAHRSRVRASTFMALSRPMREDLLRGLGYSNRDMAAMCRELNKLRAHRRRTSNNIAFERLEIAVENASRSCRKLAFSPLRIKV
jgi:hypothetical protein